MENHEFLKLGGRDMKRFRNLFILMVLLVMMPATVNAFYNVYVHPSFNSAIVYEFKSRLPLYIKSHPTFQKFEKYSFNLDVTSLPGPAVTAPGNWYITEAEKSKTAVDWIIHGGYSADEPEIPASLRHFYDPEMNEQVLYLTNTGINPPFKNPCIDAVYWAFTGIETDGANPWTWKKGKEYMELALEEADATKKNAYLAKAFRCLGEVLHNTADMGLPAHVRNDAHGGFGYLAGGEDPFESLFRAAWVQEFGSALCDPGLASSFRSATKAQDINVNLAKFTNKNFFSHETISGVGVKAFSSANGFKNYKSPKLEDFRYDETDFGYYRKFPSGREVKMCVDQSLFLGYISSNFRSTPRIDFSCVYSQASELVPDIVEAGINVVRNFIPEFEVSVSVNAKTGEVIGQVSHVTDAEYTSTISYSGVVDIWVNGKLVKDKIVAKDGKISGTLSKIGNGDKVIAKISFADITISSPEVKIDTKSLNLLNMGDLTVRAEIVWNAASRWKGVRDQFSDWKLNSSNSTITATTLDLNKPKNFSPHYVEEFSVTFNPSTQKVEQFSIKATIQVSDGTGNSKCVYTISMDKPAPTAAKWFSAGGCDLMVLNLEQMKKNINYSEERFIYKPVGDPAPDGTYAYDWVLDTTVGVNGLIESDGMGHSTGIRFSTATTVP